MTAPDMTVSDGSGGPTTADDTPAADTPATADAPADAATDPSVPTDESPARPPVVPDEPPAQPDDPAATAAALADAGMLGGNDLAVHLGADDLDAHASAQTAQGVADGTDSPFGPNPASAPPDPARAAYDDWITNPVFTHVFDVGSAAFEMCTLCGTVVGNDYTGTHTDNHKAAGR